MLSSALRSPLDHGAILAAVSARTSVRRRTTLRLLACFLLASSLVIARAQDHVITSAGDLVVSEQAISAAREALERARDEHGDRSLPIARRQAHLGELLMLAGRYDEARMVLARAVPVLQHELGPFDPALIEPLAYLGISEQALGRHDDATDSFSRAQHLTHRQLGMLNDEQVPFIYAKADSFAVLGELWEVEQLYRNAVKLRRHNAGDASPDTVDAIDTLGRWLSQQGRYRHALTVYRSALQRLEAAPEPALEEKLHLLEGNAVAFVFSPHIQTRALDRLREGMELAVAHPEEFSPGERLIAIMNLADMLMMFTRERESLPVYEQAWELASEEPELGEAVLEMLARPKLVRGPFEALDTASADDGLWFDLSFDLTADGRPRRVRVLDSSGDLEQRQAARAYFRNARFRPIFENGEAQPRRAVELRFRFAEPSLPLEARESAVAMEH